MKIIYYDNHIIAAYKDFGIATQKSLEHPDSLEEKVRSWVKEKYNKKGNVFLHAVHRLDFLTSGIVVFAKTDKSLKRMNEIIKKGEFNKTYMAVVENKLAKTKGKLIHCLKHKNFFSEVSDSFIDGFKKAELEYEVLQYLKNFSLVRIKLLTGRYHQIRAQFSHIGNPLVGDFKYHGKVKYAKNKIALIHKEVEFLHPVKKEIIKLSVELPKEWPWTIFEESGS